MKHFSILLSLVAAAAGAALSPRADSGLTLPLGEIGWEGSVTPGGPVVKVWGADLDDIEAKIKKDHPEFSIWLDEPNEATPVESSANPALEVRAALVKRLKGNCDSRFGRADVAYVNDCIINLRKVNGNRCSARARTCIRTQCVRSAAVGLCNDITYDITVNCTDVARMADTVRLACNWIRLPWVCAPGKCNIQEHWSHGQEFSPGNTWNVIVGTCGFFGNGEKPV
ncbi:hypothetical protein F5X68DRAFT_233171 [Plectosphaerella plurivora]|uniref:Uncharacterized protein n=1 Tax=Plectosphaerella plurivora TaxID=936078 RepID=A0A9P8V918_9PEZI|nr:hypothetical protein F5X68DRAFT_233171 [Plectosphaerella plurivora]